MPVVNQRPGILYSCYSNISRDGEHFIPEHIFGYTVAGTSEVFAEGKNYLFKEGDYRFFRKNQLAKFIKQPPAGGEYKTISITLDRLTLQNVSDELGLYADGPYLGENIIHLQANPLFSNYINSLTPYINNAGELSPQLMVVKVKEAILILLETNPLLKNLLFNFSEPGKIDLEAYMNEHYKFNADLHRFAYLTGRSLATFKRDFEKIYYITPNRWLQQKRLNDAYYLIKEKGLKVTDVYMEVGFKDVSHFSFAFKKAYGVAPSTLI